MHYYGESLCSKCKNKAYYMVDGTLLCGVHSRNRDRQTLPKNPNASEVRAALVAERHAFVERVAAENRKSNKNGSVIVSKLRMMKEPDHLDGFMKVFPNYKHKNRIDGWGIPELSPKALGPVQHIMPCLPPACSVENYHQFAKVLAYDLDVDGNILPESLVVRAKGYTSAEPYRHKYEYPEVVALAHSKGMVAKMPTLYSIFYNAHGVAKKYDYIECRFFYCFYYEKLARSTPEYKRLKKLVKHGYNIQIIGYDGYNITKPIMDHYLDPSQPFGHELVLYTMLTTPKSEYPWTIYRSEHKHLYEGYV
jgi:hypothetical protein